MTTSKQSFEATISKLETEAGLTPNSEKYEQALAKFRNKPFWIWNQDQHRELYKSTGKQCCFNHILSLPVDKDGVPRPLYASYQKPVIEALQRYRRIAVSPVQVD